MSLRVGIDLVDVAEVARSLERFGDRYLTRVYTAGEIADCSTGNGPVAERLAARFAAKEATIKMLAPGADVIHWTDIELRNGRGGAPTLVLRGRAAQLARRRGVRRPNVSVTHEAGTAAAVVLGEVGRKGRHGS